MLHLRGGNQPSGTTHVSVELQAATEAWDSLQMIQEQKHFSRKQLGGEVTRTTRLNFFDYTTNRSATSFVI